MTRFEEFVKEIDQLPKIDSTFVYVGDFKLTDGENKVVAQEIKLTADTERELEEKMMNAVNEMINGKKVWIRLMPVLREVDGAWVGRTRIAVMPE